MDAAGAVTLVTSGALVVITAVAWARVARRVGDLLLALGGFGMAVGGLLLMDAPAASAWAIAPPVVAGLTVLHVRLLVAPGGPLRT